MIDGLADLFAVSPGVSRPSEGTETPEASTDRVERSAEWKARRRRARGYGRRLPYKGQTGPRSTRGKRRASLNRVTRFLVPFWVAKDLRALGENPQEFRRLHRDLIGWHQDARERRSGSQFQPGPQVATGTLHGLVPQVPGVPIA
ncbi:MAG TPA: hypothetical protein VKM93_11070 [Terriglobia bacterium]|nr:hypothetical protein [Terriglobia bacterium]